MNRKKKITSKLKEKHKKKNAKLHKSNKPKYISKAERAKIATQQALQTSEHSDEDIKVTNHADIAEQE